MPPAYLSKVMQGLSRGKLVHSQRGLHGGFTLTREPTDITIWDAAAPPASQAFLLVGAVILIPIILAYTGYAYWVFRGKVRPGMHYH